MESLVLELQRDALDKNVSTTDLLRKALVVARKLNVTDTVEWITNELNGYPSGVEVPDYRKIRGELKVFNPYHGWQPLFFADTKQADLLCVRATSQSISELEQIVSGDSDMAYVKFPKDLEKSLMERMEVPLEPAVLIAKTRIHGLLDRVRNSVLEWALQLEEKGVVGEGMSFTKEEKMQAGNLTFNVSSIGNLIGSMTGSQIQQNTRDSSQTFQSPLDLDALSKLVSQLRKELQTAEIAPDGKTQVAADLSCVETQLRAPKPNHAVIRESLQSARSILEGVVSSTVFQGLLQALSAFR
ncbi:hypothetical protein [Luteimonas huabeiensis]|uniref:AbiTii domain-containing protein n=1 Tax=Luteimonas huabeiensis TaxID=1244513 RepID=UPI0012684E46|nr:hypothetical protein [Luteimonas huabeiensis]